MNLKRLSHLHFTFLGLSFATRMALSVVFMVSLILAGLGIEYWMIAQTIRHSNAQWCDTLSLLTSGPVPKKPADPKANPSRQGQYLLYTDFTRLKNHFGCT